LFIAKLIPQVKKESVMDIQESKVFQWFVNSFGVASIFIVMIVWADQV